MQELMRYKIDYKPGTKYFFLWRAPMAISGKETEWIKTSIKEHYISLGIPEDAFTVMLVATDDLYPLGIIEV